MVTSPPPVCPSFLLVQMVPFLKIVDRAVVDVAINDDIALLPYYAILI